MKFDLKWVDPFLVCKLPKEINQEIKTWVNESKKNKNHPLAFLKAHENLGYGSEFILQNSYQCSVSPYLIMNSFWLPYTLRVCSMHWGGHHRDYKLLNRPGHFDGWDVWTNFSYQGNGNPTHQHSGSISGVIYHQNKNHPTLFPKHNKKYEGDNGTMILFNSRVDHSVEPQTYKGERITLAFNIIKHTSF